LQAFYSLVLREDASFAITPSIALPTEDCFCAVLQKKYKTHLF